MVELLRTNELVLLSYIRALLSAEGIRFDEADQHMNILDGNIAAIPRRLMVDDRDLERARRLLTDAGLGHVLQDADQRPKAAPIGDGDYGRRISRRPRPALAAERRIQSRPRFGHACRCGSGPASRSACAISELARARRRCASPRVSGNCTSPAWRLIAISPTSPSANAARNAMPSFEIVVADVLKRPRSLSRQSFDHVMTNPPFHDIARGTRAPRADKARATSAERNELDQWLRFARALAKPGGWVTTIVPTEQLADALEPLSRPAASAPRSFRCCPKSTPPPSA